MLLLLLSYSILFGSTVAKSIHPFLDPCSDAPSLAATIICKQLHEWDEHARAEESVRSLTALPPGIPGRIPKIAAQLAQITFTPYLCMNLECLCTYLKGRIQINGLCYLPDGSVLKKAIRKEYRMLTDEERKRFHNAVIQLKKSGEYDKLALIHGHAADSSGAHSGPAFLPWHREFIKRFEIALRQIDPSVSLPYWDSVLDSGLPQPEDSVLFTNDLMGTTDASGAVIGGDFANFVTFQKRNLKREVGKHGSPFEESDLNWLIEQNQIEHVLAFTAPREGCQFRADYSALEYKHGNVHIFVGGDMYDPYTSGNDPLFYLHHSFVDYIWEIYRLQKQTRYQRENDYAPDNQACSSAMHFASTLMRPFTPLRNIDGLSNAYTDNLYEYAPRPTCQNGPTCGSRYLFCDRSHGQPRCISQARIGGNCSGFIQGQQVCHNGVCIEGRCVSHQSSSVVTEAPIAVVTKQTSVVSIDANCYNENECCNYWAQQGECDKNKGYMHEWCKVSCHICQPSFDPNIECSNHHEYCEQWARSGECFRNVKWMRENCRQSCGYCDITRTQVCSGNFHVISRNRPNLQRTRILNCNSPGCYNENVCCSLWGLQGQCSKNFTWMACNCKVSCGLCIPTDYDYGTCNDYHQNCGNWAAQGECNRNAWMLENCRRSCHSCPNQQQLSERCRLNVKFSLIHSANSTVVNNDDDYYYYYDD